MADSAGAVSFVDKLVLTQRFMHEMLDSSVTDAATKETLRTMIDAMVNMLSVTHTDLSALHRDVEQLKRHSADALRCAAAAEKRASAAEERERTLKEELVALRLQVSCKVD